VRQLDARCLASFAAAPLCEFHSGADGPGVVVDQLDGDRELLNKPMVNPAPGELFAVSAKSTDSKVSLVASVVDIDNPFISATQNESHICCGGATINNEQDVVFTFLKL
jgi:hypothetical protein